MVNSSGKGNADTFSSCNSSHTGSGIFFHSSEHSNVHIGYRTDEAFRDPTPVEQRTRFAQSLLKFGE
jgi:hypothetical protein